MTIRVDLTLGEHAALVAHLQRSTRFELSLGGTLAADDLKSAVAKLDRAADVRAA